MGMGKSRKVLGRSQQGINEDNPQSEDDLEDDTKNEYNPKKEDCLKYEDDLKKRMK